MFPLHASAVHVEFDRGYIHADSVNQAEEIGLENRSGALSIGVLAAWFSGCHYKPFTGSLCRYLPRCSLASIGVCRRRQRAVPYRCSAVLLGSHVCWSGATATVLGVVLCGHFLQLLYSTRCVTVTHNHSRREKTSRPSIHRG